MITREWLIITASSHSSHWSHLTMQSLFSFLLSPLSLVLGRSSNNESNSIPPNPSAPSSSSKSLVHSNSTNPSHSSCLTTSPPSSDFVSSLQQTLIARNASFNYIPSSVDLHILSLKRSSILLTNQDDDPQETDVQSSQISNALQRTSSTLVLGSSPSTITSPAEKQESPLIFSKAEIRRIPSAPPGYLRYSALASRI